MRSTLAGFCFLFLAFISFGAKSTEVASYTVRYTSGSLEIAAVLPKEEFNRLFTKYVQADAELREFPALKKSDFISRNLVIRANEKMLELDLLNEDVQQTQVAFLLSSSIELNEFERLAVSIRFPWEDDKVRSKFVLKLGQEKLTTEFDDAHVLIVWANNQNELEVRKGAELPIRFTQKYVLLALAVLFVALLILIIRRRMKK